MIFCYFYNGEKKKMLNKNLQLLKYFFKVDYYIVFMIIKFYLIIYFRYFFIICEFDFKIKIR